METQLLARGTRVERLASPDPYLVPAGTLGTVTHVYDTQLAVTAYDVLWDGRDIAVFAAGSRLRPVSVPITRIASSTQDSQASSS